MFANVIIHLKVGAQKKIVKGPAGCMQKLLMGAGMGSLQNAC